MSITESVPRRLRRSGSLLLATTVVAAMTPLMLPSPAALAADGGTVKGWGVDWFGQATPPVGLSGVIRVSAGGFHSLALKSDGTVVAWGANDNGESNVPTGLSSVTAIAAGGFHSLALKSDGSIKAWGDNEAGQTNVPSGLSGVTAIAAGPFTSLAVRNDGRVVGWGLNDAGQASAPTDLSHVKSVAAGAEHSLALRDDGTVVGWGDNSFGQATPPAGLTAVTAIAAGTFSSLALKSDGTVVAWGSDEFGERDVPAGLSGVSAIAAGSHHDLALKSDGSVVVWGQNADGQAAVPTDLGSALAIAAGESHNLAVIGKAAPSLRSVTVTSTGASISVGGTVQFSATAHFSDGSSRVVTSSATWASSAPTIATVSATGLATGQAVGSATITATYAGVRSAGAPLTVTATPPVNTTVQDNAVAVRYGNWYGTNDPTASGGSLRRTWTAGTHAAFNFNGTAVTWVTRKGPDQGLATLSIGGKVRGTYDLYASTVQNQARITVGGLARGEHTLLVTATGRHNPSSIGSNVAIDSFLVGATTTQDTANAITWGTWSAASSANASGGSYRMSSTAGAITTLAFSGKGVDFVTATGPAYGKAQIAIDGTVRTTLDLYRAGALKWKSVFPFTGLSAGNHTLTVTVLGTKSAASKGKAVMVDAFVVHG